VATCVSLWLRVSLCGYVCLFVATCVSLWLRVSLCGYVCLFVCLLYSSISMKNHPRHLPPNQLDHTLPAHTNSRHGKMCISTIGKSTASKAHKERLSSSSAIDRPSAQSHEMGGIPMARAPKGVANESSSVIANPINYPASQLRGVPTYKGQTIMPLIRMKARKHYKSDSFTPNLCQRKASYLQKASWCVS
jgi:hypothetical protein